MREALQHRREFAPSLDRSHQIPDGLRFTDGHRKRSLVDQPAAISHHPQGNLPPGLGLLPVQDAGQGDPRAAPGPLLDDEDDPVRCRPTSLPLRPAPRRHVAPDAAVGGAVPARGRPGLAHQIGPVGNQPQYLMRTLVDDPRPTDGAAAVRHDEVKADPGPQRPRPGQLRQGGCSAAPSGCASGPVPAGCSRTGRDGPAVRPSPVRRRRRGPGQIEQILVEAQGVLAGVAGHSWSRSGYFQDGGGDLDGATGETAAAAVDPVHVGEVDVASRPSDGQYNPSVGRIAVVVCGREQRHVQRPTPLPARWPGRIDGNYPKHCDWTNFI